MIKMVICDLNTLLQALWDYIKTNSIDFVAIIASILVAIQTDKWIERRKDKEQTRSILKEVPEEIRQMIVLLERDISVNAKDIDTNKLTLKLSPFETPYWDSIQNTEKINLFSNCNGYKEALIFYEDLKQLNVWENLLTNFILFTPKENVESYQEPLLMQIIEQRKKCVNSAEDALLKLQEGGTENGSTI